MLVLCNNSYFYEKDGKHGNLANVCFVRVDKQGVVTFPQATKAIFNKGLIVGHIYDVNFTPDGFLASEPEDCGICKAFEQLVTELRN